LHASSPRAPFPEPRPKRKSYRNSKKKSALRIDPGALTSRRVSDTFVDRVVRMVHTLGFPHVEVRDDSVRVAVPLGDRQVDIFVRPCGEMHGKEVLEFASGGLSLPADDAAKMPLLILALQRNADIMIGHWGLDEGDAGSTLRVFHAQITETMDLPELRGALLGVADEYATLAEAFGELVAMTP